MTEQMSFVAWFLAEVPTFLMSDPIGPFLGVAFLMFVIRLVRELIRIT